VDGNSLIDNAAQEEIMLRKIREQLHRMSAPRKPASQLHDLPLRTAQS
jgi:hypothetical protein